MAEDKKNDKEAGDEEQAPAVVPPKAKSKLPLILGGIGGLIILAGVPAAYFIGAQAEKKKIELEASAALTEGDGALVAEGATDEEEELGEEEERIGALFPLETFVINLSGGRYLRAQIQVEFTGPDISPRFYSRLVPARDALITLLTKKTQSDLESVKGRETLKSEIKEVLNELMRKEEIKRVYFTQFIIQ